MHVHFFVVVNTSKSLYATHWAFKSSFTLLSPGGFNVNMQLDYSFKSSDMRLPISAFPPVRTRPILKVYFMFSCF